MPNPADLRCAHLYVLVTCGQRCPADIMYTQSMTVRPMPIVKPLPHPTSSRRRHTSMSISFTAFLRSVAQCLCAFVILAVVGVTPTALAQAEVLPLSISAGALHTCV